MVLKVVVGVILRWSIGMLFTSVITSSHHARAVPQRGARELKVEDALLYLDQVNIFFFIPTKSIPLGQS